jgi:uncharacterized protein (TIGR01777 family)
MRLLVAGSSGFLGSHVVQAARAGGDDVRTLVRRPVRTDSEVRWDPATAGLDASVLDGVDVVVNLAGSPTIGNPHSGRWARNLRESRVSTTRVLAEAIAAHGDGPPAFVAQNALGWYGDHGSDPVTETDQSLGDSLMTRVTREWQDAAQPAVDAGARVALLRTPPVLDRESAPLKQLATLYRLGLGARLGNGRQFFPVVSLRDWVAAALFVARHPTLGGPVNICAPRTPTNAEFNAALAHAVHRPAFLVAPAFVLRPALGPMAPEILGSVNLVPEKLLDAGFGFQDADVDDVVASGLAKLR